MSLSAAELDIPDGVNIDGSVSPDEEPEMWGSILADIAAHVIRGIQQDSPELGTADEILARIELGYRDRLAEKPELEGQLRGSKN